MKIYRTLPAAAALSALLASPFAHAFQPTADALDFNVFVKTKLTTMASDIEGPAATGGVLRLQGKTVIAGNSVGTYTSATNGLPLGLVINGDIEHISGDGVDLNGGYVAFAGNTGVGGSTPRDVDNNNASVKLRITPYSATNNYYGTTSVKVQNVTQTATSSTQAHGINFTTRFAALQNNAFQMSQLSSCGSSQVNSLAIPSCPSSSPCNPSIILVSNRVNVLDLTSAQLASLNNLGTISISNSGAPLSASSPLVINVSGFSGSWTNPKLEVNSNNKAKFVIWNFHNTTAMTLGSGIGYKIYGTIFAPLADIQRTSAPDIEGQVIADKYSIGVGSGETHYQVFNANLPSCGTPLAIHLESFAVSLKNGRPVLDWATANEQGNQGFDVERSVDGKKFEAIQYVASKGSNSSARQEYSFVDADAPSGRVYYRIESIDFSGKREASSTQAVNVGSATASASVYPNPVRAGGALQIDLGRVSETGGRVEFLDGNGRSLGSRAIQAGERGVRATAPQSAGLYFVRVSNGAEATSFKIIVTN